MNGLRSRCHGQRKTKAGSSSPDGTEGIEPLGSGPGQPLGFDGILNVSGSHIACEGCHGLSSDSTTLKLGKLTVSCNVGLGILFPYVSTVLPDDDTQLDCEAPLRVSLRPQQMLTADLHGA